VRNRYWAEFQALRNSYEGQRGFILGTGPSLVEEDISPLRDETTIAVNGLCEYDGLSFDPTFYCMQDYGALLRWGPTIEQMQTKRVLALLEREHRTYGDLEGWNVIHQQREKPLAQGFYADMEEEFTWCSGQTNVVWGLACQPCP